MEKPVYRVLLQEPAGPLFRISPRKSLLLQAERRPEVRRRLWRARRFNRSDPFAGYTHEPQSLHRYAYVHGDPANGIDPTGKSLLAGLGLGLMVGLIMNAQKSSKDVTTGGAAGATATILGFQLNLRTALYLTTAGLLTAAELLRPLALQQELETSVRTRDTLRRLSEGNEPDLELEIQDELLPRDEAVRLGFINHYETRQDEIPVFVEKLSQLFEVAATDLRAQMRGYTMMLTYHDGSTFFANNRYEAQKKWKQERGMNINDPLPLTPYANPSLEEYPFANSMEGELMHTSRWWIGAGMTFKAVCSMLFGYVIRSRLAASSLSSSSHSSDGTDPAEESQVSLQLVPPTQLPCRDDNNESTYVATSYWYLMQVADLVHANVG